MGFYPADEDFEWLKDECEFRLELKDDRYVAREVVSVGGDLYDPQLRWAEPDGSVVISDIGGQATRAWEPEKPHGALWRLRPDDRLEAIVPPGTDNYSAPIRPALAPESFGDWGGHVFTIAQKSPGRAGAHQPHVVYRIAPRSAQPTVFVELPRHGILGDGVPAASMTGTFGALGTPHEGFLYCQSLVNCTVYRVTPDAEAIPFLVMAPPLVDNPMMPFISFIAPDYGPWSPYAGELLLAVRNSTYLDAHEPSMTMQYWLVDASGEAVEHLPQLRYRADSVAGPIAPADFGPFGGQLFTVDEGSTNLLHTSANQVNTGPLPYDGRILRIAPDGSAHPFAEGLQGGQTTMHFANGRLLVGSGRKSYSTGDYHFPDGSVYEIRPKGGAA